MKKVILLTAASLLAIETVYAGPGDRPFQDEAFTTASLRSTRVPRKTSEKAFSEGFAYRWQLKINGTLGQSVRKTAEETPYVDLRLLLRSDPAMPEDKQYSVRFSEADMGQILDLYRTGKLQLSWTQDGLAYQQYCVHPLDGFHTLAVTSPKGKTYYKQQQWEGELRNSPVIDVFADSKSQLEYRFDPEDKKWIVEGRKGTFKFSGRENAVKALKRLGLKYELKDRARGKYSSDPFYSFADPSTRWTFDDAENARYHAQKPSLWKTLPMGWLALTSGGLMEALRYGLTAPSSQPIQLEETTSSKQSITVQGTSYSLSSLTDLVARSTPYAAPVLLSMVSSSKSGLRSPLGILSAFGLGGLGSVAAQYMTDQYDVEGVPPMGPVFQISDGGVDLNPFATTLANGNPIVVWNNWYGPAIYGCVINGEQCLANKSFLVSIGKENSPFDNAQPVVASLSNGDATVAWQVPGRHMSDPSFICETIVNATGPISPLRNISAGSFPLSPIKIAGLNSGNALAIWPSEENGVLSGIYGRYIDSQGKPIDQNPFLINSNFMESSVSGLSNGDAFVTMVDSSSGNLYGNLYAYIMSGDQVKYKFSLQAIGHYPISTVINDTAVFVAWLKYPDIYGKLISQNGTILGKPILIVQNASFSDYVYDAFYSMAKLTNGNLFISWQNFNEAFGKVISPEGKSMTKPFQVSDDTLISGNPSVASLHNGNVLVTWTGRLLNPPGDFIVGRIVYTNQTQGE